VRLFLVGSPRDRSRLRSQLDESSVTIVGEFPSVAAARRAEVDADGILLAADEASDEEQLEPLAEPLTPRELEVLALVAEGRSNKAIAEALGISDQTVKFHVASITGKLGATNRTESVRLAVRQGLIVL
jgi:DNA-binding NarL/FixJ family response regulator